MTTSQELQPSQRKTRRSDSSSSSGSFDRSFTTGRGGAGNLTNSTGELTEADYKLPTLKSPRFTSGRGGQGNMQHNDPEHPEFARRMQDVEAPIQPRRPSNQEYHGVRGGVGNIFRSSESETLEPKEYYERIKYDKSIPVDHSKHDYRGWADKGKDLLFKRRRS